MIDPKELRIGNWMEYFLCSEYFQVSAGDIAVISETLERLRPKPIPLTEEWLIRLGFERGNEELDSIVSGTSYYKKRIWYCLTDKYCYLNGFGVVDCLYVHQLQNLFFALTGTELTIKE